MQIHVELRAPWTASPIAALADRPKVARFAATVAEIDAGAFRPCVNTEIAGS